MAAAQENVAHRAKAASSTLVTAVGMPTMVAACTSAAVKCPSARPHPASPAHQLQSR